MKRIFLFQGGGALGAYQAGAFEVFDAFKLEPDHFVATSIGALNAAVIVGNRSDERVRALRRFWQVICPSSFWFYPLLRSFPLWSAFANNLNTFFRPFSIPLGDSLYSSEDLRSLLNSIIDFDFLNDPENIQFTVSAVDVESGNLVYFDNRKTLIGVDHLLASAALPPYLSAVNIDGRFYWDGGLFSNTMVEKILFDSDSEDKLIIQLDLWSRGSFLPKTLNQVMNRARHIQHSSRMDLVEKILGERSRNGVTQGNVTIIQLINEDDGSDAFEFSNDLMLERWSRGFNDANVLMDHPEYFKVDDYFRLHRVGRGS